MRTTSRTPSPPPPGSPGCEGICLPSAGSPLGSSRISGTLAHLPAESGGSRLPPSSPGVHCPRLPGELDLSSIRGSKGPGVGRGDFKCRSRPCSPFTRTYKTSSSPRGKQANAQLSFPGEPLMGRAPSEPWPQVLGPAPLGFKEDPTHPASQHPSP